MTKASWRDYLTLCKPRVVMLMIFTAWVGMYLASSGTIALSLFALATIGITLVSASAATANHVFERRTDAIMDRTQARPVASGRVSVRSATVFSVVIGVLGLALLYFYVNPLTAYLTFATGIGYALCYTLYLKPTTPQNIVLGGLFGAMPPLLGWTAISGSLDPQPWLLVLIIFTWTPAHFWALAVYRVADYQKAAMPMLPVTHGVPYTKLNILLYTFLTVASSLLVYVINLCGLPYLITSVVLGAGFLYYAVRLFYTDDRLFARTTFFYSMLYLFILFLSMIGDRFYYLNS